MRVLLAMSGGVDSSMAAHFLKEQGHELIGVTFITYDEKKEFETGGNLDYVNDARQIADELGFKHYVVDIKEAFKQQIIAYFMDEYMLGRTPNPCVVCNPAIKWKTLVEYADEFDCEYIATGHYAVINNVNGRYFITEATDDWKDQSYFLWRLPQEYLKRTLFPLGSYLKPDIKKLAAELGFNQLSKKKESYDVCFIKDKDYREFIKENTPDFDKKIKEGNFIDKDGNVLGKHNGFPFYTIGQRKGLGVAAAYPLYVLNIDASKNEILLGFKEELAQSKVIISEVSLQKISDISEIQEDVEIITKIRYKDKGAISKLKIIGENKVEVTFLSPVYGLAPGQSAVFYDGNDLVGGGFIN